MAAIRLLIVLALALPTPAAAQVLSVPRPSGIIAAPPDPLGDIAARQRANGERCQVGGLDEIIVCGRLARAGQGYRVPWRPEPGARVRLIAGEPPGATAAMGAADCIRLCEHPVMINLLDPRSIARGIDRILSGD